MKINTVSKAFIINALIAASISALVSFLDTSIQWKEGKNPPAPLKTFVITMLGNLIIFYMVTAVIGKGLAQSMYS